MPSRTIAKTGHCSSTTRWGTRGVPGKMKTRVAGTNCYLPLDGQCNGYVGSESESVCH